MIAGFCRSRWSPLGSITSIEWRTRWASAGIEIWGWNEAIRLLVVCRFGLRCADGGCGKWRRSLGERVWAGSDFSGRDASERTALYSQQRGVWEEIFAGDDRA